MKPILQDVLKGDTRTLARVITQVENRTDNSVEILRRLFPHTGRARVIGITGSPGAGKSSLVDRLTVAYRQKDKSIGIVAVDPTSPFTGGAILGDRIRMQTTGIDPGVYIRSMATRGNLGGLAAATADVLLVLDAAGKDVILVETVGVGQDEIDIIKVADINVVVLVPGMGDDVQALKAGVMEIADIFVINKSDRPGADRMERAITTMLSLAHRPDGWVPPVVQTIATRGSGLDELVTAIQRYFDFVQAGSHRTQRRREAARERLLSLLEERLMQSVIEKAFPEGSLNRVIDDIVNRKQDPYSIVERICKSITLELQ
jgi:LAO/AO transport system kinase